MVPSALASFQAIAGEAAGRTLAFFLDYDGTLTPIMERPDLARMDEAMRETVSRLARLCPVAVVSGRDREDVEHLVQLNSIFYAGSHGFDIAGPGGTRLRLEEGDVFAPLLRTAEAQLRTAETELRGKLGDMEGALVESKAYAFTVHYRLVAEGDVALLEEVVNEVAARYPNLRRKGGKKVHEFLPDLDWDKGKAVNWLLGALGLDTPTALPIYLGDDLTDEDAFSVLERKGIGVLVAGQPMATKARYRLRDVGEVKVFLERMIELLENSAR